MQAGTAAGWGASGKPFVKAHTAATVGWPPRHPKEKFRIQLVTQGITQLIAGIVLVT